MNFYPDYDNYSLDFYFLMYLYIVVTGAGQRFTFTNGYWDHIAKSRELSLHDAKMVTLMFPELSFNAQMIINKSVSDCKGKVESLPGSANITGKSARYGGLQEIVLRTDGNKAAGAQEILLCH